MLALLKPSASASHSAFCLDCVLLLPGSALSFSDDLARSFPGPSVCLIMEPESMLAPALGAKTLRTGLPADAVALMLPSQLLAALRVTSPRDPPAARSDWPVALFGPLSLPAGCPSCPDSAQLCRWSLGEPESAVSSVSGVAHAEVAAIERLPEGPG